jgi:hypothetical protein
MAQKIRIFLNFINKSQLYCKDPGLLVYAIYMDTSEDDVQHFHKHRTMSRLEAVIMFYCKEINLK